MNETNVPNVQEKNAFQPLLVVLLVFALGIAGVTIVLGIGPALLIAITVLPIIGVRLWVQQQQLQAMHHCVAHYTQSSRFSSRDRR